MAEEPVAIERLVGKLDEYEVQEDAELEPADPETE